MRSPLEVSSKAQNGHPDNKPNHSNNRWLIVSISGSLAEWLTDIFKAILHLELIPPTIIMFSIKDLFDCDP